MPCGNAITQRYKCNDPPSTNSAIFRGRLLTEIRRHAVMESLFERAVTYRCCSNLRYSARTDGHRFTELVGAGRRSVHAPSVQCALYRS
jgi:hypothetical protein